MPPPTNFDKWQLYMRDIPSPQSYVDFGLYYMIAAALQRRVWTGASHEPIFPNIYPILCGKPGIGKTRVIEKVGEFLSYHKKKPIKELDYRASPSDSKTVNGNAFHVKGQKASKFDNQLFACGPNAATWQKLVTSMAQSFEGGKFKNHHTGKEESYVYSSVYYTLGELSTLFKKNTEDICNFLTAAYDCGNYRYSTEKRGDDEIVKCCLNFMAGTTPSFIQEAFKDSILTDGFSSRTFFIFEYANRFQKIFQEELDTDQKLARIDLLDHLKNLSRLYGYCPFSKEAKDYLTKWWQGFPTSRRVNPSFKLDSYYSRKDLHTEKMSLIVHYMEPEGLKSPVITMNDVLKAMRILDKIEKNMHFALNFRGQNPLAGPSHKVIELLRTNSRSQNTFDTIHEHLWEELRKPELEETLGALTNMGKVETETLQSGKIIYKLKERALQPT